MLQKNIDEGLAVVERLLTSDCVQFSSGTLNSVPTNPGVYLFFDRETQSYLYVGESHRSSKGLKGRMKDHWDGQAKSDFSLKLVCRGVAKNKPDARRWIMERVGIRWLTADQLGMEIRWAENFLIAVLRPEFND